VLRACTAALLHWCTGVVWSTCRRSVWLLVCVRCATGWLWDIVAWACAASHLCFCPALAAEHCLDSIGFISTLCPTHSTCCIPLPRCPRTLPPDTTTPAALPLLPSGLVERVEQALQSSRTNPASITAVLDPRAGQWPVSEATAFAHLALRCVEYQRHRRPDLREELLPQLLQLQARSKLFASQQAAAAGGGAGQGAALAGPATGPPEPPAHFVCPITQEVMVEPVFAADGYTYERMAIEAWVAGHSSSPMTNLPLQHPQLTPNLGLRSAIREWLDTHKVEL
jgi:hypothetical protein